LALNLVPGLGLCLVLTGSRPHYVDRRFEQSTDDLNVYPFEVDQGSSAAAKFAKCASVEVAEQVAERLSAPLVFDPAAAIVAVTPAVDLMPIHAAPAPPLDEAERFDPDSLRWRKNHDRGPGLYRIDLHGRPVHRRLDAHGSWWEIDLAAGQFIALAEAKKSVVRWRPADHSKRRPPCFEVRRGLSLPLLAERAACVSSGLEPVRTDKWVSYRNVSQDLAKQLSTLLLQDMKIVWHED
jgi:hypothetical protein